VLVRYRSFFLPKETPHLMKFLYNVQDLAGTYEFQFVLQVVRKHLRAVAAGMSWSAEMLLGRVDQRDQLPVCGWCKMHHISGACGGAPAPVSRSSFSGPVRAGPSVRSPIVELACFQCGEKGHFARVCPHRAKGDRAGHRMPSRVKGVASAGSRFGVQSADK
jgi:hypothetical protein